ncbi:unnamed protein product [Owenia fusiformis]|uniref:Uncharacterized protein n=1 Tax=Owenia fusiformis TaxID=6347 RepID=A0A8J1TR51_OWEFU|nr:unnamed protein product [Owenia fusiformis]
MRKVGFQVSQESASEDGEPPGHARKRDFNAAYSDSNSSIDDGSEINTTVHQSLLENKDLLALGAGTTEHKDPDPESPQWYKELNEEHVQAFREVFELLDADGGGSIDASELYVCLKDLELGITKEEIEVVLLDLDKDGNGEIDFDEFLYAMTETERFLDNLPDDDTGKTDARGYSDRQTLFFSAITKFAIKNSVGSVGRYYSNKARQMPHVLHHYTAGARLIGLTDRQLARHLKQMQSDNKGNKSPYAQPLQFVISSGTPKKRKIRRRPATAAKATATTSTRRPASAHAIKRGPSYDNNTLSAEEYEYMMRQKGSFRGRRTAVTSESPELKKILKTFEHWAEKGSVMAKLPGAHLVPEVKKRIEDGALNEDNPLCSSLRKRKQHQKTQKALSEAESGKVNKKGKPKPRGWTIPRIEMGQVELPLLKVNKNFKGFTIEDLPNIRTKVSDVIDDYYTALRRLKVKTAFEHWENLHTDKIPTVNLQESFRRVYRAYSPHAENEVFVVCPWIPGPGYTGVRSPEHTYRPTSAYSGYSSYDDYGNHFSKCKT